MNQDLEISRKNQVQLTEKLLKLNETMLQTKEEIDLKKTFGEIFNQDNILDGKSINLLHDFHSISNLAVLLETDLTLGLNTSNSISLNSRVKKFGKNNPIITVQKSIWRLIIEQFEDLMLKILTVAAIFSLIVGMIKDGVEKGWAEGLTIFIAVILVVTVTAVNNYLKEQQFARLNSKKENRNVKVLREGQIEYINIYDLLVGDLLYINIGEVIPVDGILVSGTSLSIDESSMTGECDNIDKELADLFDNGKTVGKKTPFLISGSKVMDGSSVMLVCAVGIETQMNKAKILLQEEHPPTPLQLKLERVAEDIGKVGLVAAILTFLALFIHLIIFWAQGKYTFWSLDSLSQIIRYFLIAITIIVVAVPEGLPLAVTIALAYSVGKMKDENNLVRHLSSCEIMGGANNICSDKTGTLTMNKMTVAKFFLGPNQISDINSIKEKTNEFSKNILIESVSINSDANIILEEDNQLSFLGNKTECALLDMLKKSFEVDYRSYRNNFNVVKLNPFSSIRKKMVTAIRKDQNTIRVFVNGAPEIVLNNCSHILMAETGEVIRLNEEQSQANISPEKVIANFAEMSLRTIALGYKDMNISDEQCKNLSDEELESNLTLIGIAGIKDPLRPDVEDAIKRCAIAGITVRMVTGDNIITATAIAKECGILPGTFSIGGKNEDNFHVMEGKKFREIVGGLNKEGKIVNIEMFKKIVENLKVLARSTSEDKYILVKGLIELENVVAVTGDGTNDAPALKSADVGFAMGIQGTEVAKEAADIILLDDNFSSILTACKWGRNIYDSIRKFLQFQLTVNVVALFIAFIGAVVLTQSPLNSIQMLWVNLIMDTFASLALATEAPNADALLKRKPYNRNEYIVTPSMCKNIIGQSIFQITTLCVLLFKGPDFFETPNSSDNEPWVKEKAVHFTIVFQTFVFMQIFNEINCRKLLSSEFNVFKGIFSNWLFIFIEFITIIVQILIVQFGGEFVRTSPLSWQQHLICFGIASCTLVFGFFIKLIPDNIFYKLRISKEKPILENEIDQTFTSNIRRKGSERMLIRQTSKTYNRKASYEVDDFGEKKSKLSSKKSNKKTS